MKAFIIYPGDDYQLLEVDESSTEFYRKESRARSGGCWDFSNGQSKKDIWKPVTLYVRNPLELPADIYCFNNRILIFEKRAMEVLGLMIADCGEVYELPFEGRVLYVFNAMQFIPDPQGDDDSPEEGLYYDVANVKRSIVRVSWGSIRAISGVTPPDLDFKLLVEKHNLKGLSFREVWDSDNYVPYVPPAEDEDE